MSSKETLEPLARRKTAIKNIEDRQNTMLRAEPMIMTETVRVEQEFSRISRNKRKKKDASSTYSKKTPRNKNLEEQSKKSGNWQENCHLQQSPPKINRESSHSLNIPRQKINNNCITQIARASNENCSIIENSDDETMNKTSSINSTSLDIDAILVAETPKGEKDDKTCSLDDFSGSKLRKTDRPKDIDRINTCFLDNDGETKTVLQQETNLKTIKTKDLLENKENYKTRSPIRKTNNNTQKEMNLNKINYTDEPENEGDYETSYFDGEASNNFQEKMDLDTISAMDVPENKGDDETSSFDGEASNNFQKEMDLDNISAMDVPENKEDDETSSFDGKASNNFQKKLNLDTINATNVPENKEDDVTSSFDGEARNKFQKKMDLDNSSAMDVPENKEDDETSSFDGEASNNFQKKMDLDTISATDVPENKDDEIRSLDGEVNIILQKKMGQEMTTNRRGDEDNRTRSVDTVRILNNHENKKGTYFLDAKANATLQKDPMNLGSMRSLNRHDDKENDKTNFLEDDDNAINNDVNLSRESLNLLYGSNLDMSLDLNDINELEDHLSNVLQDEASPIEINSEIPVDNIEMSYDASTSKDIEIKRQKRKAKQIYKNTFIDFISDNEDFSPGSSDYWTPSEYEEFETDGIKKKKLKKHKKVNENEKQDAKKEKVLSRLKILRKNKRKSQKELKNAGKSYENRAGTHKEEKSMKENPCMPGKCGRECYNVPDDRRKGIFDHFWTLDYQHQRDWIVLHSKIIEIKRKKTKLDVSRRGKSIEYYINEGEGMRQVCQKFLLNTLDVSQKLLQYTNNHAVDGMALPDQRSFNGVLQYSQESKKYAREFIDKLPAVSSHYCRRDSQKLYLPQDYKNISNLYRLYAEDCKLGSIDRISEKMFRQIFTDEYNLSFHVPKKDKCVQCVKSENGNLTKTEAEQLTIHIEEKKASYNRFKIHQNLLSADTVVASFDLQKVLNTPYGESMLLYYSRKYSMYNLTFYESQTQNGFCFLWGESDAKRGSNEVATCIIKYLKDVDKRGKKHVLLYCDACCGQNKNKIVLAAIHHFLVTSDNIHVIQINFLLPGHSYMPVDSMHAVIEREVKRLIVWSPSQWPTFIEAARKNPFPYKVETLEFSDILDFNELSAKAFQGDPIKDFRKIRVVTMKKKHLKNIEIKYSMKEGTETKTVEIFQNPTSKKGKGKGKNKTTKANATRYNPENTYENITLQPLYTEKQTISQAKFNDLRKLCINGTIPKRFHTEYLSLPTSKQTQDTLPQTDEEESDT